MPTTFAANPLLLAALRTLTATGGGRLTAAEAEGAMQEVLAGAASPEQIGGFLVALHFRPPSAAVLVGFVRAFRARAVALEAIDSEPPAPEDAMDVCGTGGDGLGGFNVSTCVSFVVASAGQPVAKHGNRAVSSRCGSFDVLEALGVSFAENGSEVRRSLRRHRLAFLFAPSFHPAFRALSPVRRQLGIRTALNALGPMLNPALVRRQLVGVYARELVVPMAEALQELGSVDALVVHGEDGADEVSIGGPTHLAHVRGGRLVTSVVTPEDFGVARAPLDALLGGNADVNARILAAVLRGEKGPRRDVVLLNSGAALMVGDRAGSIREGMDLAADALASGRSAALLEDMQECLAIGSER